MGATTRAVGEAIVHTQDRTTSCAICRRGFWSPSEMRRAP